MSKWETKISYDTWRYVWLYYTITKDDGICGHADTEEEAKKACEDFQRKYAEERKRNKEAQQPYIQMTLF